MISKKLVLMAVSSLAMIAYVKRREIANNTLGALAHAEWKFRRFIENVNETYLNDTKSIESK